MENKEEISIVYLIKLFFSYWKNNRIKIILFFLVPIGLMISYHLSSDDKYQSLATFKSENISYNLIKQIYEPLINSIKTGQIENTSQLLNISIEDAEKIKETSITEVKNPNTQVLGCSFAIQITVNDQFIIQNLEGPIENYLLENQYVKMIQKARENRLDRTSLKMDEQILRLDTIQKHLPDALKDQSEKSMLSDLGLGQVYSQMTSLYRFKFDAMEKLELLSEVKLISGFLTIQKITGITRSILIGIVMGFVITVIAILLKGLKVILEEK